MNTVRPTPKQIVVALEALRDDAGRWATGADQLRKASGHLVSTALDPSAFSVLGQDVAAACTALHDRVTTLLQAATTNYEAIASALHESAATYDREERANVHRLRGIY